MNSGNSEAVATKRDGELSESVPLKKPLFLLARSIHCASCLRPSPLCTRRFSKKGPPPKEWPAKSGRKRPLGDLWDQAAACSIGENGRPRLSATAL